MTPSFTPDDQQASILEHGAGALLVTGGPGTGKTSVLCERYRALIESGADPDRVVLVTASSRAKEEAKAALLNQLPGSLTGLNVVTFHGLANRVLRDRASVLGYDEPPEVLSAPEQFARVQELLEQEKPSDWPTYGHLLGFRRFADEVRRFILRAQESVRTPESIVEAARARGLPGWEELGRFLGVYQNVLDDLNQVDFAALLERAAISLREADGPVLFDHIMVDDFQDSTLAAEALLHGLRAPDIVVAANPEAHIFSFQGMTRAPLDRFAETFGAQRAQLVRNHRAPTPIRTRAWVAPHVSEEYAAVARELRRLHIEDAVAWREMAVVVRRHSVQLGGLLRALDDAQIPRVVPERELSLGTEPATHPYILALRWLVSGARQREELVESLLTSDVVGLSPVAARGLLRAAQAHRGTIAEALEVKEGMTPSEIESLEQARTTLAKAALFAGMSAQDAFRILWEELPCSRTLVDRATASSQAQRELDTVVTLANAIADTPGGDVGVEAFLEELEAGRHGPGFARWDRSDVDAVRVLTAHGASGQEFHSVFVTGTVEGNFPSISRPEPMFDLSVLERSMSRSQRNKERLEDERRLFRSVLGRARAGVVLTCTDTHEQEEELSTRSRFVDELPSVLWQPAPAGPFHEPVSVQEASASWRRGLADRKAPAWRRLADLEGLVRLGADPGKWWFQRDWTATGRPLHEDLHVSYSRLKNMEDCELRHVLGDELGLSAPGGYHAWVGKTIHGILEDAERGTIAKEPEDLVAALDARWRPQEFPSLAISETFRSLARDHMLRNWYETYGKKPALAIERRFEFPFEGATVVGYIDRIGPAVQDGTVITDFKTGKSDRAEQPHESLQLGIYFLAVQDSEALAEFKPVRMVELAFLRGNWKSSQIDFRKWPINERSQQKYEAEMRERLTSLVHRKRELNEADSVEPSPYANCRFCEFTRLCPLFPEGQPIFPLERS